MLAGELPLERVGPHLRHSCRKALLSGKFEAMYLAAKVASDELVLRGELIPVSIENGKQAALGNGPFCVVKGTRQLVDLSVFGEDAPRFPQRPPVDPVTVQTPEAVPGPKGETRFNQEDFFRTLWYMEHAQKMDLGSIRPDEKGAVLLDILELFDLFPPQFSLFVQFLGEDELPDEQSRIFKIGPTDSANEWVGLRAPGHSVWLPDGKELPLHIRSLEPGVGDVYSPDMDLPFQMAVAVPLYEPGDEVESTPDTEVGLLYLVVRRKMDRDQLLRLAGRVSRFVTRSWRKQNEVNHRIHIDPLTGVYNKGFYLEHFPLEIERARRGSYPLSYIFADLDNFKPFNSKYGHGIGDVVLKTAVQLLQVELRKVDLVCRYGGEEFVLLLPNTSPESAQEVIGRLLDTDFSVPVTFEGETRKLKVTFSYGAISFPDGATDGDEVFEIANRMMYLAKNNGRNRCYFHRKDEGELLILPTHSED